MSNNRIMFIIKLLIAVIVMLFSGFIALILSLFTLFKGQNICRQYIARPLSNFVLSLFKINYTIHRINAWSPGQRIYISNHTSTLDVFLICGLGLPNTRFFMSKVTRKYIPMTLLGYLIGIFYIDTQDKPLKRTLCFQKAEATLRRTGESVYLSPEGMRVTSGNIGKFNRGAFHLATNLKAPICPFYIHIPHDINPGTGLHLQAGHIDIYELPEIDTRKWTVEEIENNKANVRNIFVEFHEKAAGFGKNPSHLGSNP